MEGLTQYGDSDSDQEQQNSSAPSAGLPGKIKRCPLLARYSHFMFIAVWTMLRIQGRAEMAMLRMPSLPSNQCLKAWARRPLKPCPVQRLSYHREG